MSINWSATDRVAAPRVFVTGRDAPERERIARMLVELGADLCADRADLVIVLESNGHPLVGLREICQRFRASPVIFVAYSGSEHLAVEAFRSGANDYLRIPITPTGLAESLRRLHIEPRDTDVPGLIGESPHTQNLRLVIKRIAVTPCSVLISGETGTGKDLIARLIHESSPRAQGPFVTINCSALPETLFESELFGYERGAFTGAQATSIGRLQAASGGTVLLDEVGELSLTTQPKLLRAIDQREVQRLGSRRHETIDVRWVAATNRNLQELVRSGLFRADLFYRLNVYSLVVPPLRERPDDVPVLARAFLRDCAPAYGRLGAAFTDEAVARLAAYEWPGNVRELRNVVESSVLTTESDAIGIEALPPAVRGADFSTPLPVETERVRVVAALRASHGNKSEAAQRLNWSRMTLYRKLARHRIDVTSECDSVTAKLPRE
ncbi:MAG TPA: sigma-54 dependent transcriptional regulator [Vicinamibacterales bacterium]|nr:sigma-54 dependent transcriptional regulator [Vicinamibacterales bacterium]